MKRFIVIALLLVTCLLSAGTYTLDDLVKAGLDNAYSLRQKQILLKNADLSVKSAAWDLLPTADITASRTNKDEFYANRGSLEISKSISINDPAFFNYFQSKMDKTIALIDVQQARKELVYSIYSAWLGINQTQKEIAIRTENLSVLQRIKEQTVLQKQLGQRTTYDVSQNDINVINAQLAIAELKNTLAKQRADLFNQVKLPDNGEEIESAPESTEFKLEFTKTQNEPFPILKIKEDMYKTQLDKIQQKYKIYPSLVFSGSYDQHSMNNDILDFGSYEDSYTLSVGLSWSLWSPWTKGNNYAQIKNSLMLKQWQYDEGIAALSLDQANLQREWNYLQESLNLNIKKAQQAKDNFLIATEKYNLGTMSLIELEQARVNSLDAELAVNTITYQMQKKMQEWNLLNSYLVLGKY